MYIHPRCKETLNEFENYSWKIDRNAVDPRTGQNLILDVPVDEFNHYIDALRYALSGVMLNRGFNWDAV